MKYSLFLLTALFGNLASASDLTQGLPITAAQLAQQLNVKNWSLVYSPENVEKEIDFQLVYKSRKSPEDQFVETYLVGIGYHPESGNKKLPVVIYVDGNHSTIIFPDTTSSGKGVDFGGTTGTMMPPSINDKGNYILLQAAFDGARSFDGKNLKGQLELTITPRK